MIDILETARWHYTTTSFRKFPASPNISRPPFFIKNGMQLYPGNCLRTQGYLYRLELQRFCSGVLLSRKTSRWQFEYAGGDLVSYQCCGGPFGEYDDAFCYSVCGQAEKVSLQISLDNKMVAFISVLKRATETSNIKITR